MARPLTKGLRYYPLDTDIFNDDKIFDLLERYGPLGFTVYSQILCRVYHDGYYSETNVNRAASLAVRAIGSQWVTKERAINVIDYCGEIGLFRVDLLGQGVITSAGIQRRYYESKTRSRRKFQIDKYWVLDKDGNEIHEPLLSAPILIESAEDYERKLNIAVHESEITVQEHPINVRKGKENKRKESKGKGREGNGTLSDPAAAAVFQTLDDCGFMINARMRDQILSLLDDYGEQWTVRAIQRAADRNVHRVDYVAGILKSWQEKGGIDERGSKRKSDPGEPEKHYPEALGIVATND